jgi:hypothetical protein
MGCAGLERPATLQQAYGNVTQECVGAGVVRLVVAYDRLFDLIVSFPDGPIVGVSSDARRCCRAASACAGLRPAYDRGGARPDGRSTDNSESERR